MYSSPKNFKQLRTIIRQNTKRDSLSPIHTKSCFKKDAIGNNPTSLLSKRKNLKENISPARYTSPKSKITTFLQQKQMVKKSRSNYMQGKLFGKLRKCISDKKQTQESLLRQLLGSEIKPNQTLSKQNIQCNIFEDSEQEYPSSFKQIAKISISNGAMQFSGVTFENIIKKIDSTRQFFTTNQSKSSFNLNTSQKLIFKKSKNHQLNVLDCNQSLKSPKGLCLKLKRIQSAVAQMETIVQCQQSSNDSYEQEQVNQSRASSTCQLNMDLNF